MASRPTKIGSKSIKPTKKINPHPKKFSAVKYISIQSLESAVKLQLLDVQVG